MNRIDPLASWNDKLKNEYGLSYAKIIADEWFNGGLITSGCQYYNRREWIVDKRLRVRGEQDEKPFKDRLIGELDLYNQDFRLINFSEKFCNIVSNGIDDENYRLDIRANDKLSLEIKKEKKDQHLKNMRTMPMRKEVKEKLGLDTIPQGFVPQDEEELNIYSEMNERPVIEIAEELIIDYVKRTNQWHLTQKAVNRDLVALGICASRTWTDPTEGVMHEYVDPEYLIHGRVQRNDFSKCPYYGYIDEISIADLRRESTISDAELRKIAQNYKTTNKSILNIDNCEVNEFLSFKVEIMRFAFKTSKSQTYKTSKRKGKTVKLIKKKDNFNPPKNAVDYGKTVDRKVTWMEGSYVIGTESVYNYQECENIIKDELNKPKAPFSVKTYDMYKNQLHSFLDNIEPIADALNETTYKIRHLRSQLRPDNIEIDIDSLADISSDDSGDKNKNWQGIIDIFDVKGILLKKRVDMGEMGIKEGAAARSSSSNQGGTLQVLFNDFARDYNLIRDITGINPARDGSLPADALLGVNQMAELASNTVTKHIVDAATEHNKEVCEVISSRIHRIFDNKDAKHLKKRYEKAVGKQNIEALEAMKNRHLHDFGFTVEMLPTAKVLNDFKEDLTLALQDGTIDVEIKSEAQRIAQNNTKLAIRYWLYKRKKQMEQKMKERQQEAQIKSQADMQSNQMATQNRMQTYEHQKQVDLKYEESLAKIEIYKKQALMQLEKPLKDQEFQQEVYLKQLETASTLNMRKFQEDAKDYRLKDASTYQSKLIDQRQKKAAPPIDFNFD